MWKPSPERRHVAGGDLFDLGQHPHGDAYPDCDGKGGPQQPLCTSLYSQLPFQRDGSDVKIFSFDRSNRYQHMKLTERHHKKYGPASLFFKHLWRKKGYILFFLVPFRHPANRIHRMLAGRLAARCPAQLSASPVKVTRGNTFLAGTR